MLRAFNVRSGCVGLIVTGAQAEAVTFSELIPGEPAPVMLGTTRVTSGAAVAAGIPWDCARLSRTFQVTETLTNGTPVAAQTTIHTPSCAHRLGVELLQTRAHRGFPISVDLTDRWHLGGLHVRGCLDLPTRPDCATVTLPAGHSYALLRLRAHSRGVFNLTVNDGFQTANLKVHVISSKPLLLATGDSEMQVLDELLASDLGTEGVHVTGDARQSTAISSPSFFNWPAHALAQVASEHPDIVAMFLGGNEGFRLGHAECCGTAWAREYALRVEGMMRAYRQHGAAAVYWFLIPTPSREPFVKVVRAVNEGIEIAATDVPGAHTFDLRPVFSPGGRYIDSLTLGGRTITVHESDGFHLSASADRFVARMFIARLRKDGVL